MSVLLFNRSWWRPVNACGMLIPPRSIRLFDTGDGDGVLLVPDSVEVFPFVFPARPR